MKTADDVMMAAQLAAALEVSATPKPGNVHRGADYPTTRFEHFLAGAIALGPAMRNAAQQGGRAASGAIEYSQIGIGRLMRKAVNDVNAAHSGGNTHLGICMLFTPLTAAAEALVKLGGKMEVEKLRNETVKILESTTSEDTVEMHRAVSSLDAQWLGHVNSEEVPDLASEEGLKHILKKKITLHRLMEASAEWDGIAEELAFGLPASFTIGYPMFTETYWETGDVNTATVNTYLKILSKVPDTFVARKAGLAETKTNDIIGAVKTGLPESLRIANEAEWILEAHNGMRTEEGRLEVRRLDSELRQLNLNPGTTADITAASLLIAILCGFKP
jgi:triphosphoribosyl-dephospho-CoA synthase